MIGIFTLMVLLQISIKSKRLVVTKVKLMLPQQTFFGSPSLFDSTIYNGTRGGALHSINPKTLSIIWTKYGFQWTVITAADEFALYVTEENRISALQKSDGSLIWSTEIIGKNSSIQKLTLRNYILLLGRCIDRMVTFIVLINILVK